MLVELSRNLGTLNATVAKHFLALAAVLQANSELARNITASSYKATGSNANTQTSQSIEMLQQILTEAAGTTGMADVSSERMSTILGHMTESAAPLDRLSKARPLLQTISILSRIEVKRLSSNTVDLTGLSSGIEVLSTENQQHLDSVHDDSATLRSILAHGIAQLASFGQQERTATSDLVAQTQAILGPAIARSEALRATALSIDEQYLAFLRSTDKIVMSLQSEDLARQRVEHIQVALNGAAQTLATGVSIDSSAAILILQRAQLVSTRDLLRDAIQSIQMGLLSTEPQVQQLVERTAALAQQSTEDRNGFLALVDSSRHAVLDIFGRRSSSARSVLATVSSVTASVEKMTRGAYALERIQTAVRLLSINAIIKTEQLGTSGAAMGVLATEMQELARQSDIDTAIILEQLSAISGIVVTIANEASVSQGSLTLSEDSAKLVETQLSSLSEDIRASSHEMSEGLNEVRQLAANLCADAQKGCELATSAQALIAIFEQQLLCFDRLFDEFGITHELAAAYVRDHHGDDLSRLYSMESERALHREIFGGAAEATPSETSTSEFGDDVELF